VRKRVLIPSLGLVGAGKSFRQLGDAARTPDHR
jgi:hypothetical protein